MSERVFEEKNKAEDIQNKYKVFISYSRKDEAWKKRLVTHFAALQFDIWDDRRIETGKDWHQEIQEVIKTANLAILLVSADFLASKWIISEEVPRLLERRDKEGLRIFPVIIKPCAWKQVNWLARMSLHPKDGRPISSGDEQQIETDLLAFVEEVTTIIWQTVDENKDIKVNLQLSPSVESVERSISKKDKVLASVIVASILRAHPEYAEGKAKTFNAEATSISKDKRLTVNEWLYEVRSLYDQEKVPLLHGRIVVLGLSLLDQALSRQLTEKGILSALIKENREPFESILTPKGHELQYGKPASPYSVPTHSDNPTEVDQLGRKAFAQALAINLRGIYESNQSENVGAFLLHIHGPWGSGKTSFLNFLRECLKEELQDNLCPGCVSSPWIVVNFNAWQHQRLGPPWWSLMNAIYQQASQQIKGRSHYQFWIKEWSWRLSTGRLHYYMLIALFFWALALIVWRILPYFNGMASLSILASYAQSLSIIFALIVTFWSAILGISHSLVSGSARSARTFMESTRDPLEALKDHFKDLVKWIQPPIAIFIDDVDRCQASYSVELLEGIQTLFRDSNVFYVIAADGRWLRTSYENVYDSFTNNVNEPGRPLGYLFLEKTFQLSVSLPRLSPELQDQYWQFLIRVEQSKSKKDTDKIRVIAQQKVQLLQTEGEILAELKRSGADNPVYDQAIREASIVRLAMPDFVARTEHALRPFASLLEPNPRAMKRLVNAYGFQRIIYIYSGVWRKSDIEPKKLALWTIIHLRWPLLAEYHIGNETLSEKENPEDLRELFQNTDVYNVIEGKEVGISLDEQAIRTFAGLRTTDSSRGVVT